MRGWWLAAVAASAVGAMSARGDAGKAREAAPGAKFFRVSVSLPDEP